MLPTEVGDPVKNTTNNTAIYYDRYNYLIPRLIYPVLCYHSLNQRGRLKFRGRRPIGGNKNYCTWTHTGSPCDSQEYVLMPGYLSCQNRYLTPGNSR